MKHRTNMSRILARCHANYIAQINIRMNERAEQTNDVLGKLTVLGTIVLPMNIITGLWGMNVWVPGQDYEGVGSRKCRRVADGVWRRRSQER